MAATLADKDVPSGAAEGAAQRVIWRWVLLVFVLALAARSAALTRPLLGNFATKNAAYGMIARNFARGNAPAWRPSLDVLSAGQRGAHLLEVPLSAYAAGLGWKLLGGRLDCWGRCVAVFCSALTAALLVILGTRWFGARAGIAAGMAYAFSPVAIIYGQSFMLEASVALFAVAALLSFDLWRQGGWPWLLLCGLALSALFLTKIYMLVLCLPIGWLANSAPATANDPRSRYQTLLWATLTIVLAAAPAIVWVAYVYSVSGSAAESKHIFYSLRNSADAHAWPPPILRSFDFYRQLLDDLTGIVLTPVGFVCALLGLSDRRWWRLLPWLASCLILVIALPLKFHEMNYYFVPILPPCCLLIGLGWQQLARLPAMASRWWQVGLLFFVLVLAARYAAKPAFLTPAEDCMVLAAAQALDEATEREARVVTVHGSSIDLLYYCDRTGWALSADAANLNEQIAELAAEGATAVVIANTSAAPSQTVEHLREKYRLSRSESGFLVLLLTDEAGGR